MRAMGEYKRLNAGVEPVGGESILGGDQEERGGGGIHYFRNNTIHVLTKRGKYQNFVCFVVFFRKMFSKEDNTHLGELSRGGKDKSKTNPLTLP